MITWHSPEEFIKLDEVRLYRGFSRKSDEQHIFLPSPTKRRPRNIGLDMQEKIDDWFESNLGLRFRENGLFCTGDRGIAQRYAGDHGEVRTIAACSEFALCWSPVAQDLYEEVELFDGELEDLLRGLQFRCYGLVEAVASNNEILLVGTSFRASKLND